MPTDHIRYDLLAQEALRGVVRRVLADVARNGLPGEHHFYVTFDTHAPGVNISERLKTEHPEEMTIVLQHQFWDLEVDEHAFEVGLSFKGVPERLGIPFDAIKGFFDPSVQFGLQFETSAAAEPAAALPESQESKQRGSEKSAAPATGPKLPLPAASPASPEPEPRPPADGGQVVRLDRFRKK